jgi:hypothetical protein
LFLVGANVPQRALDERLLLVKDSVESLVEGETSDADTRETIAEIIDLRFVQV